MIQPRLPMITKDFMKMEFRSKLVSSCPAGAVNPVSLTVTNGRQCRIRATRATFHDSLSSITVCFAITKGKFAITKGKKESVTPSTSSGV